MKTTLQVDTKLLEEFQDVVTKEYGKLKGAQSEALAEAVKLWLAFRGRRRYFAHAGAQVKVLTLDEVRAALEKAAKEKAVMPEAIVVPLFETFDREELRHLLGAVVSALGEPSDAEGSLDSLEHDDGLAVFGWKVRSGEGGYALRFVVRMGFRFVGYSRLWSAEMAGVRDLLWGRVDDSIGKRRREK